MILFTQDGLPDHWAVSHSQGHTPSCWALFVTVGAGAALSSLVSAVPHLVWLSENKEPLFVCRAARLLPASAARGV